MRSLSIGVTNIVPKERETAASIRSQSEFNVVEGDDRKVGLGGPGRKVTLSLRSLVRRTGRWEGRHEFI